jgi:hypothetical protein
LGREYDIMPIPMVPEACVPVPAGPVTFVVESRRLTDAAIGANERRQGKGAVAPEPLGVDDGGASLHVLGAEDGLEHLRFDCFDLEPHYHYIHNDQQMNVVVRIDTHAEGDPVRWATSRVRARLPEMLAHAGATELSRRSARASGEIAAALDEVERLLEAART